ncbi:MAG: DUF1365 domain-containing protein [Rhodospirillaceae bacterium]
MTLQSAIYIGEVVHERLRPTRHRLRYRVFSMLFDLDELPDLDRRFRLFGYNRRAPIAFFDSDHGPVTGEPLRPWVEARLRDAGLNLDGGAIRVLCYPRLFGYVFNPISVYFCYSRNGSLIATLYEVCNTYHERHTYVIPVEQPARSIIRQSCDKALYVSPFIGMKSRYRFRVLPPAQTVRLVIRQEDEQGLLLAASFRGERRDMNAPWLARTLARFPLLTLKVMAAIHWEAAKLWIKRVKVIPHQPARAPVQSTAVVSPSNHTKV